jgi:hypothetical protein|nr:MAG TPA: hypothetical protein [Caudoviricetes sp.]DAU40304.1 MAG TPA: hypothetical protein [Caudoviricetes sp.]
MQTVLSVEDVYDILEISGIDAHNRSRVTEHQEKMRDQ